MKSKNGTTSITWETLLTQIRTARQELDEAETASFLKSQGSFLSRFPELDLQLKTYVNCVSNMERTSTMEEYDNTEPKCPKQLLRETRAGLRFGLSCLSLANFVDDGVMRSSMQRSAICDCGMHVSLCRILSATSGDAKCRTLAGQLLSNLITSNSETTTSVVTSVATSPSKEDVQSRIMRSMSLLPHNREADLNWVDMMMASVKAENRDSLAAIVAVLHNCIASLQAFLPSLDEDATVDPAHDVFTFASTLASDHLLISTILRHILSANVVSASFYKQVNQESESDRMEDSATEWVILLVEKFCRLGLLAAMFSSVAGENDSLSTITPEQIVLLYCVEKRVQDATSSSATSECHPLGGEGRNGDTLSSIRFLCTLSSEIGSRLTENDSNSELSASDNSFYATAYALVIEILASSMGVDDGDDIAQSRLLVGRECGLLTEVSHHLGRLVDEMSSRNRGAKARELQMSQNEQRLMTALVSLVGNVCFKCRENQDLMRTILVPFSSTDELKQSSEQPKRTALHVLLSCTSFSYGCFTLREWAIVAVRNVLDGNEKNQKLVEDLEAQQPIQNAELQRMGVRVNLDRRGKVSVSPTDESESQHMDKDDGNER